MQESCVAVDKLKNHTSGDKVKLHIKDDADQKDSGQDTQETTTPNGDQQPAVQY